MTMASPPTMDLSGLSLNDAPLEPPIDSSSRLQSVPASTTPSRPSRNPLRQRSSDSSLSDRARDQGRTMENIGREISALNGQIANINDRIYEIQELRHSSSSTRHERLNNLLAELATQVNDLSPRMNSLKASISDDDPSISIEIKSKVVDLQESWERVSKRQTVLGEEMKEDGWLVRFRTTADQAEAMIDPLSKSLDALTEYVIKVHSIPQVPFESAMDDDISIKGLKEMDRNHTAMRRTYVPSITKILKMMDKSLSERTTKNGEALRRFGDMSNRWNHIQKSLSQVDAKIQVILHQYEPHRSMEVLKDHKKSPLGISESDYFALGKGCPGENGSYSNSDSSSGGGGLRNGLSPPSISPSQSMMMTLNGRHRGQSLSPGLNKSTSMSMGLDRSAEKPRWNGSTRVDHSPSGFDPTLTPTMSMSKRMSSFGWNPAMVSSPSKNGLSHRATSPTFSTQSNLTSISRMNPPGGGGSNIPVSTPKRYLSGMISGSEISSPVGSKTALAAPLGTLFPRTPSSKNDINPRLPLTTGNRQRISMRSTTGGPPTSYRSFSPSPNLPSSSSIPSHLTSSRLGPGTGGVGGGHSRPSSRLSMSQSVSKYPMDTLKPFIPSKYDLLDQTVYQIIQEEKFDLYVCRLDFMNAMKKGQRRSEAEEWKGEFIFGAGEKPSSVKLLKLKMNNRTPGGVGGGGKQEQVKCLVRKGGMWVSLADLLRERKEAHGDVF